MSQKLIAVASDHAGFKLKSALLSLLHNDGFKALDLGAYSNDSVDYPVYASKLINVIEAGDAECGIIICGSGIGISIAANRSLSIRAALCRDKDDATMARRHNDANVIALSGQRTEVNEAWGLVKIFLNTKFDGGRHARRVDQLSQ
jgi:ribose 5-phosphate isomerase B